MEQRGIVYGINVWGDVPEQRSNAMRKQSMTEALADLIKARATYNEDTATALATFNKAREAYKEARADFEMSMIAHDRDIATAQAALNKAVAPARAEYGKALGDHNKARAAGEKE